MHDPMVVAFDIRRPWRDRAPLSRAGTPLMVAGKPYRYRPVWVTVWHVEPGGRDSGTVCKHDNGRWRWHVHHWRVQVAAVSDFKRWAFSRCRQCGGRFRWGDGRVVGYSWDGPGPSWFRDRERVAHMACDEQKHRDVRADGHKHVWEKRPFICQVPFCNARHADLYPAPKVAETATTEPTP